MVSTLPLSHKNGISLHSGSPFWIPTLHCRSSCGTWWIMCPTSWPITPPAQQLQPSCCRPATPSRRSSKVGPPCRVGRPARLTCVGSGARMLAPNRHFTSSPAGVAAAVGAEAAAAVAAESQQQHQQARETGGEEAAAPSMLHPSVRLYLEALAEQLIAAHTTNVRPQLSLPSRSSDTNRLALGESPGCTTVLVPRLPAGAASGAGGRRGAHSRHGGAGHGGSNRPGAGGSGDRHRGISGGGGGGVCCAAAAEVPGSLRSAPHGHGAAAISAGRGSP